MTALIMSVFGCTQQSQLPGGVQGSAASMKIVEKLSPAALKIIEEGLADDNPQVRVNAIETVADNKMMRFMPKVGQMLKDEVVPVRFAATMAIADTDYQPAKFYLDRLLRDKNENVRIAAIYAIAKMNYPSNLKLYGNKKANLEYLKALEPLGKAITSSDQTVRANAALILGKSGSP
ncbi:MAG: HEAT repeat domain-containing protein, partial [Candidatus Brocadiia bacterium]